jgi:hypothetical protein
MAGGIDVDHSPTPAGRSDDPRSYGADDPELIDPAVERRKDEGLYGLTVWGHLIAEANSAHFATQRTDERSTAFAGK